MVKGLGRCAALAVCLVVSSGAFASEVDFGARIVKRAKRLVGVRYLSSVTQRVPDDCSGVVRFPFLREGVDLLSGDDASYPNDLNAVTFLYLKAKKLGAITLSPQPGDLAFFRETYDRNRDGRRNDGLTHVAIVEKIDDDGTITLIHHGSHGVARTHMNLMKPSVHRDEDKRMVNDVLVTKKKGWPESLTSELFVAFARSQVYAESAPVMRASASARRTVSVR